MTFYLWQFNSFYLQKMIHVLHIMIHTNLTDADYCVHQISLYQFCQMHSHDCAESQKKRCASWRLHCRIQLHVACQHVVWRQSPWQQHVQGFWHQWQANWTLLLYESAFFTTKSSTHRFGFHLYMGRRFFFVVNSTLARTCLCLFFQN